LNISQLFGVHVFLRIPQNRRARLPTPTPIPAHPTLTPQAQTIFNSPTPGTFNVLLSHTYTTGGSFLVSVIAIDQDGGSVIGTATATITDSTSAEDANLIIQSSVRVFLFVEYEFNHCDYSVPMMQSHDTLVVQ
jgi:hypothetical protein